MSRKVGFWKWIGLLMIDACVSMWKDGFGEDVSEPIRIRNIGLILLYCSFLGILLTVGLQSIIPFYASAIMAPTGFLGLLYWKYLETTGK